MKKTQKPSSSQKEAHHPRTITRKFKGADYEVTEGADGFGWLYEGVQYRSLTAIAQKITGYKNISGPAFFGQSKKKEPVA